MSKKKKKKEKKQKKYPSKAGVEERVKKLSQLEPPEQNPYKQENENKIDRWRPQRAPRKFKMSIAEFSRKTKRGNRPKRPRRKVF